MSKGQFYVIVLVFISITIAALLMLVHFVEFSSLMLKEPQVDFKNLQNAVKQRNIWLSENWFDLNWKTKTIVNITGDITNPVEIDAGITANCNSVRVFNKTNSIFIEIPSNVTSLTAPCNVTFDAAIGVYEIYWNGTNIGKEISQGNENIEYTKAIEQVPPEGICSHFSMTLPKKGILFSCSAAIATNNNTYNYFVNFTSPDFSFKGNLM
ncbi:MAG: hypothetical protein QW063_02550 [Candidatus Nanoarchaeia archaeon]